MLWLFALQVGIDGVDENVSVDAVNGTGLLQIFAVGHYAAQAVHAGAGEYLGDADIGQSGANSTAQISPILHCVHS